MRKPSLSSRIEKYLRIKGCWINGGEIERLALLAGYKASNGSRRCRELENDRVIERKDEGGSVWYRYVPKEVVRTKVEVIDGRAVMTQQKTLI